jgi:hypothetical protein
MSTYKEKRDIEPSSLTPQLPNPKTLQTEESFSEVQIEIINTYFLQNIRSCSFCLEKKWKCYTMKSLPMIMYNIKHHRSAFDGKRNPLTFVGRSRVPLLQNVWMHTIFQKKILAT